MIQRKADKWGVYGDSQIEKMKERTLEQVSKFLDQERFGSITITKSQYRITIELGSIQTEWSMPPEDIK